MLEYFIILLIITAVFLVGIKIGLVVSKCNQCKKSRGVLKIIYAPGETPYCFMELSEDITGMNLPKITLDIEKINYPQN